MKIERLFVAATLTFATVIFAVAGAVNAGEPRSHDSDFSETLEPGMTLEVDNVLGSIVAAPAGTSRATIHAHATAHSGDPARAAVRVERKADRVVVCVVDPAAETGDCGHRSTISGERHDDIVVDFTLAIPTGVRLVAHTVNGNVRAAGLHGDVAVETVRGDVTLANDGRSEASAVNGTLDVRVAQTDWTGELKLRTVNGPIHVTLPRGANATVRAQTLGGAIRGTRGLPLSARAGDYVGHSATATLGTGGSRISLETIDGEIVVGFD